MSHGRCAADIYSLGVCLLEIGLCDTFVIYSAEGVAEAPGAALELSLDDIRRKRPSSIKEHLVTLAKHRLPRTMGEVYTEVVVSCLTCLDEDNTEYANDEGSGDVGGLLVGLRYIEQVREPDRPSLYETNRC